MGRRRDQGCDPGVRAGGHDHRFARFRAGAATGATFDNDGTLWAEQPTYFQFLFVIDRIRALADEHPDWKTNEPYGSVLAGDMKAVAASGEKGAVELLAATHIPA